MRIHNSRRVYATLAPTADNEGMRLSTYSFYSAWDIVFRCSCGWLFYHVALGRDNSNTNLNMVIGDDVLRACIPKQDEHIRFIIWFELPTIFRSMKDASERLFSIAKSHPNPILSAAAFYEVPPLYHFIRRPRNVLTHLRHLHIRGR
ncbi:hypothetical protein EVAR_81041_1 [Eumeta japonica]|uniref:Uncharacterized protein n=1 Tax=Eumeta variegata TaxID=151549 RepID=A0A4C1T5S3_EUMVA|nr:hypothetical protein EVAR_81041_1 [Eumeta japonica]